MKLQPRAYRQGNLRIAGPDLFRAERELGGIAGLGDIIGCTTTAPSDGGYLPRAKHSAPAIPHFAPELFRRVR